MDIQMPLMNGIEARHLFTALLAKPMRLPKLCEALEDHFKEQRRH